MWAPGTIQAGDGEITPDVIALSRIRKTSMGKKRTISRLASGPRGSVKLPKGLPPDQAWPAPWMSHCSRIASLRVVVDGPRVSESSRCFAAVHLRVQARSHLRVCDHVISVTRMNYDVLIAMEHNGRDNRRASLSHREVSGALAHCGEGRRKIACYPTREAGVHPIFDCLGGDRLDGGRAQACASSREQ